MSDRPATPRPTVARLLLTPVAFAAVFGPIARSRAAEPLFWAHVLEGRAAFWGAVAAVALAEAVRRSPSRRSIAAVAAGYGAGLAVGPTMIPCTGPLGPIVGPAVNLLVYRGVRGPAPRPAAEVRFLEDANTR